jgi:hypothetical protein
MRRTKTIKLLCTIVASAGLAGCGGGDKAGDDAAVRNEDSVVASTLSQPVIEATLPSASGLIGPTASSGEVDGELVRATYCRIAAAQVEKPVGTLAELARRAFVEELGGNSERSNRATLVAISLAVAGEQAEFLLPGGAELRLKCSVPAGAFRLQGRVDLAKHWALSASLATALGAQAAERLGEMKELNDSLVGGSGFSFLDLAADRAGVQTAVLAADPETAVATNEQLRRATDEYLLPKALLQAPEGLSQASLGARFGDRGDTRYRNAVSKIDRILAQRRR